MSLESIAGNRNIPATLVTLLLQLWNSTDTALVVPHEATWGAGELYDSSKDHEWACWKKIEFSSTNTHASWTNTWEKQGCNCQVVITKILNPCKNWTVPIQPFQKTLNHSVPVLFIASSYCLTFVHSVLFSIQYCCLIIQCIFCSDTEIVF
jgi:hypothetical protein